MLQLLDGVLLPESLPPDARAHGLAMIYGVLSPPARGLFRRLQVRRGEARREAAGRGRA